MSKKLTIEYDIGALQEALKDPDLSREGIVEIGVETIAEIAREKLKEELGIVY